MDIIYSGITVFLSFVVVYIAVPFLRTHLGKKELTLARDIITDIVASLEGQSIDSQEKKRLAMTIAKNILKAKKIKMPDMFISALIESTLYFLRKGFEKQKKRPKKEKGVIATYSVKSGKLN